MSQTSPVTETVKLLRRRAAGFMARDMSIFNGRIIAEELKEIAREVEAMAARSSDHAQQAKEPVTWQWFWDARGSWFELANTHPDNLKRMRDEGYSLRPLFALSDTSTVR